jgi:replication initiation protein RepC
MMLIGGRGYEGRVIRQLQSGSSQSSCCARYGGPARRRYRGALLLATATRPSDRDVARIAARVERVVALVGVASKAPSALLRRASALFDWFVARLMQLPAVQNLRQKQNIRHARAAAGELHLARSIFGLAACNSMARLKHRL